MTTVAQTTCCTKHPPAKRRSRLTAFLRPHRKPGLQPGDPAPCHPQQALMEWPYNPEKASVCPEGDHFYRRAA